MTSPSFSFIYMVDRPEDQMMACLLLASIRRHFPAGGAGHRLLPGASHGGTAPGGDPCP